MNKVGIENFTCRKCGKGEPEVHFSRCRNFSNGLNRWCKICQADFYKDWLEVNRVQVAARKAAWYKRRQLERRAECLSGTNVLTTVSNAVPTVDE